MASSFAAIKGLALGGCAAAILVALVAERPDGPPTETPPQAARAVAGDPYALVLERARDGHFWLEAEVNGAPVRFLVDTGASHVVLTPEDAERAGIRPHADDYIWSYRTANGTVAAAPVRIDSIEIEHVQVSDVQAAVNGGPLDQSLLGMSFLERLAGYEVKGGRMILRQ